MQTNDRQSFDPSKPLPAKMCALLLDLPGIPSELCLIAGGHLETADGLLILDDVGARKLEAQFANIVGGRLPIGKPINNPADPTKPYGSFRPEVRQSTSRLFKGMNELWAIDIEWAPSVWQRPGLMLTAPVLDLELSEGRMRIVGIQSFALVNIAATPALTPKESFELRNTFS